MANLRDILQGLIDTDKGLILKLKKRVNDISEKIERGSGTYALVDINTPDILGDGALTNDPIASHGQCISLKATQTDQCIYSGVFSDIKFGKYALCMRIKVDSNTNNSSIFTANLFNGAINILEKPIKGTDFDTTTQYCYLCTTFTYDSIDSNKEPLEFSLYTSSASNVTISFDYAYITLMTPAVYV
jgi:hypothetical protein